MMLCENLEIRLDPHKVEEGKRMQRSPLLSRLGKGLSCSVTSGSSFTKVVDFAFGRNLQGTAVDIRNVSSEEPPRTYLLLTTSSIFLALSSGWSPSIPSFAAHSTSSWYRKDGESQKVSLPPVGASQTSGGLDWPRNIKDSYPGHRQRCHGTFCPRDKDHSALASVAPPKVPSI